jgi:hypothetical protein
MSAPRQAASDDGAGRPDLADLVDQIGQIASRQKEMRQAIKPAFVSPQLRRELRATRRAINALSVEEMRQYAESDPRFQALRQAADASLGEKS